MASGLRCRKWIECVSGIATHKFHWLCVWPNCSVLCRFFSGFFWRFIHLPIVCVALAFCVSSFDLRPACHSQCAIFDHWMNQLILCLAFFIIHLFYAIWYCDTVSVHFVVGALGTGNENKTWKYFLYFFMPLLFAAYEGACTGIGYSSLFSIHLYSDAVQSEMGCVIQNGLTIQHGSHRNAKVFVCFFLIIIIFVCGRLFYWCISFCFVVLCSTTMVCHEPTELGRNNNWIERRISTDFTVYGRQNSTMKWF